MPLLAVNDKNWRHMDYPHHATPASVTTDYIRALLKHVYHVLKMQLGPAFDSMTFTNVITVPATWSDKAQAELRKCAEEAGMGDLFEIRIISEPEAAAVHALRASSPNNLKVNDTVLLIDAGGGTVDLITFTIEQLTPALRLRETVAELEPIAGVHSLNRRFEDFLRKRLESSASRDSDTLEQAMVRFEDYAKRRFTGDTTDIFSFLVPGIEDDEDLKVRRGFLRVTGEEMRDIFLSVLDEVLNLALKQIKSSKSPVKTALIVGGFGQNQFLRDHLQANVSPGVKVLAPPDGWTAVVRGALAKVLSEVSPLVDRINITSRIARRHYGHLVSIPFDDCIHDSKRK